MDIKYNVFTATHNCRLQQRAAEEIKGVKEWIIIIKVSNQRNAHAHLYIKKTPFLFLVPVFHEKEA